MASNLPLPACPTSLKTISHQLKTANEHENRDPVVTYWCRLSALQTGMKLDKASKEALAVLLPLMDWLEREKKVLAENEAVTNEVVASAHVENYAMKLFGWADKEDRASHFNKNVVKAFYTCGILFDVMTVFGELTPENAQMQKYAKWKAAYIHNCLKAGETPVPGPAASGHEDIGDPGAIGWSQPGEASAPPTTSQDVSAPASASTAPTQPKVTPAPYVDPGATYNEYTEPTPTSGLTQDQVAKTQKLCKYAVSALDYDDKNTAIDNLEKALRILKTGRE